MGAKKATGGINFEEAQKKAKEEEERVKRLGYDKIKEEEEARVVKQQQDVGKGGNGEVRKEVGGKREVEGPKVVKLGFGQTAGGGVVESVKP